MSDLQRTLEEALGHSYRIERELGGGGMSRVFLAEEAALERRVVIKVLPGELAAEINAERFRREIQLAAKLQHPYIVPVLATGMAGGHPYFTMPFVEGESLRAHLQKRGELPVSDTIVILRDVLEALAYAHECGVVHRDIKPENILLARNHAHVADFGVAKALSASTNAASGLTSLGVALGTPAYMAPEQAMADPGTDHRADLYAVGALGYEMLTGHQVFSARSPQAMLAAHATEAPEPISRRRPNIPPALAELITRLLDKRPADRPQSANEALAHLAGATTPSGGMTPTMQHASTTPWAASSRRRAAVRVAIGLAVVGSIAFAAYVARSRGLVTAAGQPGNAGTPSIAVMPFENMSGDPKNDYLGDGLSEELIGGLSRVRGLQVAARTSSFAFKGKNEDVKTIGAKLGVTSVLGGSVRRSGNKLRVSVQLTSASTGYNLWSETYDRDMSDVFAVEDDISKAIVGTLAVRFASSQPGARIVQQTTSDPVAYDLYLKGRYALQQRGPHLFEAKDYFNAAISRDSTFALAWSGLSDVYAIMPTWGYLSPSEAEPKAIRYAEAAVSLAPTVSEPHTSLGFALCQTKPDDPTAMAELRRALELNPTSGWAHYYRALCLLRSGNAMASITEALEAERLEPLNGQFVTATARGYAAAHNYAKAIEAGARAERLAPQLSSVATTNSWVFASVGDTARMRTQMERVMRFAAGNRAGLKAFLALVSNDRRGLASVRPEIEKKPEAGGIFMAGGYAMVHNADSAIAWIDRAYAVNGDLIGNLQFPVFDWLRSDPRYGALERKYGIRTPGR